MKQQKEKHKFNIKSIIVLLIAGLILTWFAYKFEVINTADSTEAINTLEIQTSKGLYYVDLKKLEVQPHGADSAFYFKSYDSLMVWIKNKTTEDSQLN